MSRIFSVLEFVADNPGARQVDVTAATGLAAPTAHRLLQGLVEMGYLRQNGSGFGVSVQLAALTRGLAASPRNAALEVLQNAANATGLTAYLAERHHNEMVYLLRATPTGASLISTQRIGHRAPLYCTGVGKAVLAEAEHGDVDAYIRNNEFHELTPHTITTGSDLRDRLREIRKNGYARDDEECEIGVACTAFAFPDRRTAISVSGSVVQAGLDKAQEHAGILQQAAKQLALIGAEAWQ